MTSIRKALNTIQQLEDSINYPERGLTFSEHEKKTLLSNLETLRNYVGTGKNLDDPEMASVRKRILSILNKKIEPFYKNVREVFKELEELNQKTERAFKKNSGTFFENSCYMASAHGNLKNTTDSDPELSDDRDEITSLKVSM